MPVWSCDGKQITYPVLSGSTYYVYQVPADSSGLPQLLLKGAKMIPNDWSPDGHLVFMDFKNGGPPACRSIRPATTKLANWWLRIIFASGKPVGAGDQFGIGRKR